MTDPGEAGAADSDLECVGVGLMVAISGRHVEAARLLWPPEPLDRAKRAMADAWVAELSGEADQLRTRDARGDGRAAGFLGLILTTKRDEVGAREAFGRADERGDSLGALGLGALLLRAKYVDDAEQAFDRAADRGDATVAGLVALLRRQRGDVAGSAAAEARAIELGFDVSRVQQSTQAGVKPRLAKVLRGLAKRLRPD